VREARGCSADVRRATISSEKSARSSAAMASRIKRQPYTTTGQTTDYRLGFSQIISIAWTHGKTRKSGRQLGSLKYTECKAIGDN
jgi:hypothetical protein